MADKLSDVLDTYKAATLTAMASFNGLTVQDQKTKARYLRVLIDHFGSRSHIQQAYRDLSPAERELVDTLMRNNGRASTYALEQRLAARKLIDTSGRKKVTLYNNQPDYRQANPHYFDEVTARLQARGLVFGIQKHDPYSPPLGLDFNLVQEYFIPSSIRIHLPDPPPLPAWNPPDISAPARVQEGSSRTFQRDLYFYWSYLRSRPVELTAKGLVPKRNLTGLNETLLVRETIGTGVGENDFPRLIFLRRLLTGLGALNQDRGFLNAQAEPAFLKKAPVERIKACFEEYVTGRNINELAVYPNLAISSSAEPPFPTPNLVIDARKALLMYLKMAPRWTKIASLIAQVREVNYEFLFKRTFHQEEFHPYYYRYPSHPYTSYTNPLGWNFNDISEDASGWERVEAAFIRQILQGPLFWMGLVNLGYSNPGLAQPDTFCLTSIGAWLLAGGRPPEINQAGGRVILQPNFQITAFDPISDEVLLNLERFAERVSADRAIELRLTQASVYSAQQKGWDANRIQSYLQEVTGAPVPDNVARTLNEWQMLHERITIFPRVTLVHAADPQDLDSLSQEKELKAWLKERPAPSLALLPERNTVHRLVRALVERAWIPLISQGENKSSSQSVEITPEGCLRFKVATPDLYLHGRLARFADPAGTTAYQMTAASVQRAVHTGMTAPAILAELKQMANGEVPAALEKRILAWSGHYGDAELEEVVLLHLRSADTLKELQDDPELGPLLHPLEEAWVNATARVRPKDLDRLRQLLAERGIKQH
jgi:hypothetical protein